MFKHEKMFLHPVRVDRPNPNYAAMMQEQLGGPQGELKSALQYLSQSMRIKDPEIKDLFLDVAAEELCHLEMVSATVNMLNGHEPDAEHATVGNIEAHVLTGLTPVSYTHLDVYKRQSPDCAELYRKGNDQPPAQL